MSQVDHVGLDEVVEVLDLGNGRFDRPRRAAIAAVVRVGTRPWFNDRVSLDVRRRALSMQGRIAQPIPDDVVVDVVTLGGRPCWRFTPEGATGDRSLLYLHGGGYNYGDVGTHGGAVATLASSLAAVTWMPDYRVVPEAPATAPLEDALAAWRELAPQVAPARTAFVGDSAGAHLALSLACEVRDADDLPDPAALVLLSPWVDADPARAEFRRQDAILSRRLMARDSALWLGDADPKDPHYSPLFRELAGLPPTLVQWGRHEALHADAERLVARLLESEVDVTAEAFVDLWHDAFLQVPMLAEAGRWLARTAIWTAQRMRST